jgi:hypothetical protein
VAFCIWLLSLSVCSGFIHVVVYIKCFISFLGKMTFYCIAVSHFLYEFISCWFYFSVIYIMLLGTFLCKFSVDIYFNSLQYIPRTRILGHVKTVRFIILRICQTDFHCSYLILQYFSCVRVPMTPHPWSPNIYDFSHPNICEAILLCISLMTNEHLFMGVLCICVCSLE